MRPLAFLLALLAAPASANMASPVEPGAPAGEPAASLAGLRVAREALTIDLRPLARTRLAVVEAEYRIVNPGPARVVPLEFLALGEGVEQAQVWLDEQPVPALALDSLRVPALWRTVDATPALDGQPVPYQADASLQTARGLSFVLTVPPGQHTVRVRYHVWPGSYDAGEHPNRVWQLAYSLAPARLWAGFGQLDVRVVVPPGWDAAASLPLRREGDALVGRFPGVPGDVLAVSARAPVPRYQWPLRVAGGAVALALIGFVGAVAGRVIARTGRRARAALPVAVLGGVLAAVAIVALAGVADDLGDSSAYGYGSILRLVTVVGPLAIVVGAALTQAVAVWAARRWRAEGAPPGFPTASRN